MAKKALPPVIYVHIDGEPGDQYLSTHETPADAIESVGHGGRVGIYQLAEVREAKITQELKRPEKQKRSPR